MQRLLARWGVPALVFVGGFSCGGGAKEGARTPPESAAPLAPSATDDESEEEEPSDGENADSANPTGRTWAETTFSPQPGSSPEPELDELLAPCGRGDAALHEVASYVAEYQAKHDAPPSLDAVNFELKRQGSPYVMPRLWAASVSGGGEGQLTDLVKAWSRAKKPRGQLRCGIGAFDAGGERHVAVLQVDVAAELMPLPTLVATSSFVDLEVAFLLPTTAASVVLLPPDGPPRTLTTTLEGNRAKARLSIPTAGSWLVQVMATQDGGPLPVASALLSAGKSRPDAVDARPVPGEKSFDPKLGRADALFALVNAARKDQGLPLLKRNAQLDRAAVQHSERMKAAGQISHDSGDGDPARRVEALGLTPKATGENVALAASVPRLHRALWASPSHRENLLLRRWDQAGIGIVERDDGSLYCTQLFIDAE